MPIAVRAIRTHSEVARIMTQNGYPMSRSRVEQVEKIILKKLAYNLQLRTIAFEAGIVADEPRKEKYHANHT